MGAACCGLAGSGERRKKRSTRRRSKNPHSATEPLLRDNEREAVSSLLRYLEGGKLPSLKLLNNFLMLS